MSSKSIKGRMKNKWWTLFYYAFFHFSWSFVQGTPEKLTQEQVLEELGVKIETKGKKSQQQNCFFFFLLYFNTVHNVWKLREMSHLNFWILTFSTNFCLVKSDLFGNTFCQILSILASFSQPEACGQIVLPDRAFYSTKIGGKWQN